MESGPEFVSNHLQRDGCFNRETALKMESDKGPGPEPQLTPTGEVQERSLKARAPSPRRALSSLWLLVEAV